MSERQPKYGSEKYQQSTQGEKEIKSNISTNVIFLNPLQISGILGPQTPSCVIDEVISFIKNYQRKDDEKETEFLNRLNNYEGTTLKTPLGSKELLALAFYVNPKIKWNWRELWSCFLEIQKQSLDDMTDKYIEEIIENSSIGKPEPGKKTVTLSFLYRAAVFLGIPITKKTTGDELLTFVDSYIRGFGPFVVSQSLFKNDKHEKIIIPKTKKSAVELGAENFSLDLGWLKNPIFAYFELMSLGKSAEVSKLQSRNSQLCKINHVFNPDLVPMYNSLNVKFGDTFENLQLKNLLNNFWEGWFPTVKTEETFTCYQLSELDQEDIICFGSVRENLTPFSFGELAELFENQESLEIPIEKNKSHRLDENQTKKLQDICKFSSNDSPPIQTKKIKISNEITRILNKKSLEDEVVSRLIDIFEKKTENRKTIEKFMNDLFVLGMIMRGWDKKTKKPYPLRGTIGAEGATDVGIRVQKGMTKLRKFKLSNENFDLMKLPMFQHLTGNYQKYSKKDGGTNIGERLDIVEHHPDEIHACIRLTSSIMIWTSLFYMEKLSLKQPVNVEEIKPVS